MGRKTGPSPQHESEVPIMIWSLSIPLGMIAVYLSFLYFGWCVR